MKLYKITDKDGRTQNNTQWGENITHTVTKRGHTLCSDQVIHAYKDPYLAVFHNPIGGDYDEKTMLLWEAKGRVVANDGLKVGCKTLTTIKQIDKPTLTIDQKVEIAIKCAVQVYKEPSFIKWANEWLDGTDRSKAASYAASRAASNVIYADYAASCAAYAASRAAYAVSCAASRAAYAVSCAASNVIYAVSYAVSCAASNVTYAFANIDTIKIIHEVIEKKNAHSKAEGDR